MNAFVTWLLGEGVPVVSAYAVSVLSLSVLPKVVREIRNGESYPSWATMIMFTGLTFTTGVAFYVGGGLSWLNLALPLAAARLVSNSVVMSTMFRYRHRQPEKSRWATASLSRWYKALLTVSNLALLGVAAAKAVGVVALPAPAVPAFAVVTTFFSYLPTFTKLWRAPNTDSTRLHVTQAGVALGVGLSIFATEGLSPNALIVFASAASGTLATALNKGLSKLFKKVELNIWEQDTISPEEADAIVRQVAGLYRVGERPDVSQAPAPEYTIVEVKSQVADNGPQSHPEAPPGRRVGRSLPSSKDVLGRLRRRGISTRGRSSSGDGGSTGPT